MCNSNLYPSAPLKVNKNYEERFEKKIKHTNSFSTSVKVLEELFSCFENESCKSKTEKNYKSDLLYWELKSGR